MTAPDESAPRTDTHLDRSAIGPGLPELTLPEALSLLWRAKWVILVLGLVAAGAAGAAQGTRPGKFQASTLIRPPLFSPSPPLAQETAAENARLWIQVLNSPALQDEVIHVAGPALKSGSAPSSAARDSLASRVTLGASADGLITVSVLHTDGEAAVRIADAYVEVMGTSAREFHRRRTSRELSLLKKRLADAEGRDSAARKALRAFREKTGFLGQPLAAGSTVPREKLPALMEESDRLQREVQLRAAERDRLLLEEERGEASASQEAPEVEVFSPTASSPAPAGPGIAVVALAAFLAGSLLGAFAAMARPLVHRTLHPAGD